MFKFIAITTGVYVIYYYTILVVSSLVGACGPPVGDDIVLG